jgi:hypothetical protein
MENETDTVESDSANLRTLPAKANGRVIDSGHLLAYFKAAGIEVDGDTVIAYADGSVQVETTATDDALTTAWDAYVPEEIVPPETRKERLRGELAAVTSLAEMRTFLRDKLIPALMAE